MTLDKIQSDASRRVEAYCEDNECDSPSDLLADVMHWAEANAEDFEDLLRKARGYYEEESA